MLQGQYVSRTLNGVPEDKAPLQVSDQRVFDKTSPHA